MALSTEPTAPDEDIFPPAFLQIGTPISTAVAADTPSIPTEATSSRSFTSQANALTQVCFASLYFYTTPVYSKTDR